MELSVSSTDEISVWSLKKPEGNSIFKKSLIYAGQNKTHYFQDGEIELIEILFF